MMRGYGDHTNKLEHLIRRLRHSQIDNLDWAEKALQDLDKYLFETERPVEKGVEQNFSRWHYRGDEHWLSLNERVFPEDVKKDPESFKAAQEKAENRENTPEEDRWDEITSALEGSLWKDSENTRRMFQLKAWVEGYSVHDERTGLCCPDRSCCEIDETAPKESRERYLQAHLDHSDATDRKLEWISSEYLRRNNPNVI